MSLRNRIIWARFSDTDPYCAIASVTRATSQTYCQQTQPTSEMLAYDDQPPHADRCEACCRVLVDRRCIERGLSELLAATGVVA